MYPQIVVHPCRKQVRYLSLIKRMVVAHSGAMLCRPKGTGTIMNDIATIEREDRCLVLHPHPGAVTTGLRTRTRVSFGAVQDLEQAMHFTYLLFMVKSSSHDP